MAVWFNGNITPYHNLHAETFDRAWRFADGGFETLFFNGTEAPLYEWHRVRAQNHARHTGVDITLPAKNDFDQLLQTLATENGITGTARCRITWFRQAGGFYLPQQTAGHVLVELFPFDPDKVDRKPEAVFYDGQPLAYGTLSPFKKIGAHVHVDAARFAQKHGAAEALLLNTAGHVAEAVSSNIIIRSEGVFYAPPVTDGGVEGVMLTYLARQLSQWGYAFERRSFTPDELLRADEILTVNALRGICCIILLQGKQFTAHSLALNKRLPIGSKSET